MREKGGKKIKWGTLETKEYGVLFPPHEESGTPAEKLFLHTIYLRRRLC